jgi:tRNA pseudouridine13 synthase
MGADGKPFDIEEELASDDDGGEASDDEEEERRRPSRRGQGGAGGGPSRDGDAGPAATPRGRKPRLKSRPQDFRVVEVMQLGDLGTSGVHHIHRLRKKKLSTQQALSRIAKAAGLTKSKLSYAGLKDKQALAVQFVGVEGCALELRQPGLQVTFLGRRRTPISSSDLIANRFRITVRGLTEGDLERLDERVEQLRAYGVPNYFDSQRFGSVRHGQGLMARELVKGDAETALRLWMGTPSRLDHSHDRDLKKLIKTRWGEWGTLAKRLRQTTYGRVLGHLSHQPGDWMGAVGYMPRQARAFHLFAYQSLLWNRSAIELLRRLVPKGDRFTVPYECGRLTFNKRIADEGVCERLLSLDLPLLAPDTTYTDPDVEAACTAALAADGIALSDLALPQGTGGFFKTEPRRLIVVPDALSVSEASKDELEPKRKKVELRFDLPRGSYGTLMVKRLFRG